MGEAFLLLLLLLQAAGTWDSDCRAYSWSRTSIWRGGEEDLFSPGERTQTLVRVKYDQLYKINLVFIGVLIKLC